LLGKFLPSCDENENYPPWELFATQYCLSWNLNVFTFFHIQGLHSLQAPCQLFLDRSPRLWQLISHSIDFDIQLHFMNMTSDPSLLLVILVAFRVLNIIMSYGRSKCVIELNQFNDSKFWETRKVNISISSMKIKIMLPGNYLQHTVVYFEI
jgi:hypothetical protein